MYRAPGHDRPGRPARWLAAFAAALVLVLALTSCGSSEPTEGDRFVACDLLRRADVQEILDGPVVAPAASNGGATDRLAGRSGCAWSTTDHAKAVLIELVRTHDMAGQVRRTGFSAEARFDAAKSQYPSAGQREGLGDEAIYIEEAATLHLLEGDSYVIFEVAITPPANAEPAAVELARRAVIRLRQVDRAD